MKSKKISKKLIFKKATISNIENSEMKVVKGGETYYEVSDCASHCATCYYCVTLQTRCYPNCL